MLEDQYAPGMVPHVYFFDTVMCACGMEDCSDYAVMRDAMLKHETFPGFAEDVSTFMVNTLLLSSDVVMDHKEKKELVKKFISPDLCDITEKLVLMEPYMDLYNRNNVYAPNRDFVKKELYEDEALHLEVSKLKFRFMTDAQALLHGDLHTAPSLYARIQQRYLTVNSEPMRLWVMMWEMWWLTLYSHMTTAFPRTTDRSATGVLRPLKRQWTSL